MRFVHRPIARRLFLRATVSLSLLGLLTACGGGSTEARLTSVALDTFPQGLGRGYPLATLDGVPANATLRVGSPAPDFRLHLDDSQGIYLQDLKGRPVIINFWATWCGPCRLEMPDIVRKATALPDLVVIAVNVQEELQPITEFAADFAMALPIARDEQGQVRDLYGVRGMPTTIFIGRDGNVASVWAGVLTPSKLEEFLTPIL